MATPFYAGRPAKPTRPSGLLARSHLTRRIPGPILGLPSSVLRVPPNADQNVIKELITEHTPAIYFPAGDYFFTGPLSVPPGVDVFGNGVDETRINYLSGSYERFIDGESATALLNFNGGGLANADIWQYDSH